MRMVQGRCTAENRNHCARVVLQQGYDPPKKQRESVFEPV
jgi:hypothetical protein